MTELELVLRWSGGELDLMGTNVSSYGSYELATLADGTNWGNPESVRRVLRSAMLDGSRSAKDRDDNRTIPLKLRASAVSHSALSGAEQSLALVDGRPCELVWTPPGTIGIAPSVFVVDFADLKHEMNDLGYERGELFYALTLSCLPHAYSDEWVEVPALAQSVSTRTEFDDCSSLTGWTSFQVDLTLIGGGGVQVIYPEGSNGGIFGRGGEDFTTDRYLAVAGLYHPFGVGTLTKVEVLVAGTWREVPRVGRDAEADLYDVGVEVDAIGFTVARPSIFYGGSTGAMAVMSLGKQATMRTAESNGHVRTIATPGSYRTPAHVLVESETDVLGDLVLYSGPDYDPSLVTRLAPGTPGPAVSTPPGADEPTTLYMWPISEVPPGEYVAWAQFGADLDGGPDATVRFEAELHTAAGLARSTVLADVVAPDGVFDVRPLFAATLPPWDVPQESTHQFGLRVTIIEGSGLVQFPWLWLFNVSDGNLVVVKAGNDSKVWAEPPSLDRDHPLILTGDTILAEALPRSLSSELLAWGGPMSLTPPVATIYAWSSEATDATVSARFRPAWHTHPPALS